MTQRPSTPSLADLFKKGFDAQKTIESGNLASDSKEYKVHTIPMTPRGALAKRAIYFLKHILSSSSFVQQCLAEAVSSLEAATVMVNNLGLFSSNEELEDVATADLKCVLRDHVQLFTFVT